jgi:hypothetical protein
MAIALQFNDSAPLPGDMSKPCRHMGLNCGKTLESHFLFHVGTFSPKRGSGVLRMLELEAQGQKQQPVSGKAFGQSELHGRPTSWTRAREPIRLSAAHLREMRELIRLRSPQGSSSAGTQPPAGRHGLDGRGTIRCRSI